MKEKLNQMLLASSLIVTSGAVTAKTVYVGGQSTKLTQHQMTKTRSGGYVTYINVSGDNGQTLLFDVDVALSGMGQNQYLKHCIKLFGKKCFTLPSGKFYFEVATKVSCSGIPVVYKKMNANTFRDVGKVEKNKRRSLNFLLDGKKNFGGRCKKLKVELIPSQFKDVATGQPQREKASISNINLDVHVLEVF
ncbi:hypothetical protein [Algicola sagamiensis]|uniref:hypothetical protein n=1 Tax=Algicola sagamiensis TaxID=163869 RepID=UPI00035DED83|nr:hypothetical protein [Algicola sagamiensis]